MFRLFIDAHPRRQFARLNISICYPIRNRNCHNSIFEVRIICIPLGYTPHPLAEKCCLSLCKQFSCFWCTHVNGIRMNTSIIYQSFNKAKRFIHFLTIVRRHSIICQYLLRCSHLTASCSSQRSCHNIHAVHLLAPIDQAINVSIPHLGHFFASFSKLRISFRYLIYACLLQDALIVEK